MLFYLETEAAQKQKIIKQIKHAVTLIVETQVVLNNIPKYEQGQLINKAQTRVLCGSDEASIERLRELLAHQRRILTKYKNQLSTTTEQNTLEYTDRQLETAREGIRFDW